MKILLGIAALALVELVLLIALGALIGFWLTVLWIVATAVLGIGLLRLARPFSRATAESGAVADRLLLATAGLFLILPGPLADLGGLLLLLPPVRAVILAHFAGRIVSVYRRRAGPMVVDAGWREVADANPNPDQPRH